MIVPKVRQLLIHARELKAAIVMHKFESTDLHLLWSNLLIELEWDLPVISICRDAEVGWDLPAWTPGSTNANNPKYTYVAPGKKAAINLTEGMSGIPKPFEASYPTVGLNDAVTHALLVRSRRTGSELKLAFDVAKMIASGGGGVGGAFGGGVGGGVGGGGGGGAAAAADAEADEPIISVLIDGGVTMLGAAALSAERNIPVLSLRNTGRLADVSAMHLMMDSPSFTLDDPAVKRYITRTMRPPGNVMVGEWWALLKTFLSGKVVPFNAYNDAAGDGTEFGQVVKALLEEDSSAAGAGRLRYVPGSARADQVIVPPDRHVELLSGRERAQGGFTAAARALRSQEDWFHVFLSHTWAQGQDEMRIAKSGLMDLCPALRVFLDVDNLKEGAGGSYVDISHTVLVFCTEKYFRSRACARELLRAVLLSKPLISVLEPDKAAGGLSRKEIEKILLAPGWVSAWELDGEVAKWGELPQWKKAVKGDRPLAPPTGAQIVKALFGEEPPVEWNRLAYFQQVTLRLVAERLLEPNDRGTVYVQDELGSQPLHEIPLTNKRSYHLYVSPHCHGAKELAREMRSSLGITINWTADVEQMDNCELFLLYLTSATWTSLSAKAFAEDVVEAQRLGVKLLLAHEFPSFIGDDASRHACAFNDMWKAGWTPEHLLKGDTNVYKQIATALKPGGWRKAGLAKLAQSLAEGGGKRAANEGEETEAATSAGGAASEEGEAEDVYAELPKLLAAYSQPNLLAAYSA